VYVQTYVNGARGTAVENSHQGGCTGTQPTNHHVIEARHGRTRVATEWVGATFARYRRDSERTAVDARCDMPEQTARQHTPRYQASDSRCNQQQGRAKHQNRLHDALASFSCARSETIALTATPTIHPTLNAGSPVVGRRGTSNKW
jgi:hypothetical protein